MNRLILLRHGQSEWNLENRFTGWTDVRLSAKGEEEARSAGKKIKESGLTPNFYFTSYLRRAIHTLQIAADVMERDWIPVTKDWHLNERHYGALQGLNKKDTANKFGEEQVHEWRRGFDERPPLLTIDDPRWPGNDPKYSALSADEIPCSESLHDTIARVRCCWEERIIPALRHYNDVMVVAHGNSLRALIMMLRHLSADEIQKVELPTGSPLVLELDERINVLNQYYL
ncbi:MAG: 2,3-diphosphoglycerate-dependent phosphoglycerate mutase [Firmicutes bacterium]|nr:2,3-diphosphoglycerate-dependent phosphoglycerate mutase [Bacillota bacterium]MCM1401129.1 2,3-diphosphoglycerate-dependent phosphoglycerate mutase [Bacteroides sp.]MCM1477048.1 2,3-diphosphoglycerate-dependent phosphoglycerate mutase [Bacteroides sp.]